jgi:hypothetical protein
MQHATTTFSQGATPFILSPASQNEKDLGVQLSVSKNFSDAIKDVNENALLTLMVFFEESKILETLSYTFIPAGNLYFNNRVVFRFSIAKGYEDHFVLLRGLLGFGKPPHVLIVAEPADRTFVIEVTSEYADAAVSYFQKIFTWLAKEIKFKSALKEIMRLQREAQRLQEEAFTSFYSSMH